MFVRWKKQLLKKSVKYLGMPRQHALYAVLIQSYKKNGKPAQRFIKHLGGICESELTSSMHRQEFWRRAERALSELEIEAPVKAAIRARLHEKVKRPA